MIADPSKPVSAEKLEQLYRSVKGRGSASEADAGESPRPNAVIDALAQIAPLILEKWHTPTGEPMITVRTRDADSYLSLRSDDASEYVMYRLYLATGKVPSETTTKSVIALLAAQARHEGDCHPIFSRIAHLGDEIYIYLGDEAHRVVRISPRLCPVGFEAISSSESPVRFRETPSAQPLPFPVAGGDLAALWTLFPNVTPEDRMLIMGWLIGCFQETGGRNFLEILGGQGSGKSTLARCLLDLIDPNLAPMRSMPKNEQDLLISVMHRIAAGVDNVSIFSPDMSDAWCRLSTGAAISMRRLFTDSGEALFVAQLAMLWTAIEPQAIRRPDLQDRTSTVRLDPIASEGVVTERMLLDQFESIRPELLGAIYSAVATALSRQHDVSIEHLPRLADFAIWVEAAVPALGLVEGEFLNAFEASRAMASEIAVEASPIGSLIVALMGGRHHWEGTASDLLEEIRRLATEEQRRNRSFPKDATRLSGKLRTIAPPLKAMGLQVVFLERTGRSRGIEILRLPRSTDEEGWEVVE